MLLKFEIKNAFKNFLVLTFSFVMVCYSGNAQEKKIEKEETAEDVVEEIEIIEVKENEKPNVMPFYAVENVPYPSECESSASNEERKKCVSKHIQYHVMRKFKTDLAEELGLPGGRKRILTQFKFDESGKVTDIRSRGPHPELEKEAERVLKLLTQFNPGMQGGKPVTVTYSMPILFEVAETSNDTKMPEPVEPIDVFSEDVEIVEEVEVEEENPTVPFAIVENPPHPPKCAIKKTAREKMQCTSQFVQKHVAKRFNTDIGTELGLSPGKKRILVIFKIDKTGKVTKISARGPHPDLEAEAIRVIGSLPDFKPGKQRGKPVIVPYSLPIVFTVEETKKNKKRKN